MVAPLGASIRRRWNAEGTVVLMTSDRYIQKIEYGSYPDNALAIAAFREVGYIRTKAALSRILGMEPKEGGYRVLSWWARQERRPSPKYLRRLCRLRLWADEGLPLWDIKRIKWEDLEIEWNDPDKTDNPFYMSRWTTFPFGARRDSSQLLRDLERVHRLDILTKGPRAAVSRLFGMDPATVGWARLGRWRRRERYMGPKYLLRLLWLLLWTARGYMLADIHFVHWDDRRVDWVTGPPDGLPANTFDMMDAGPPIEVKPATRLALTVQSEPVRSNPGGLVLQPREIEVGAPLPVTEPVPVLDL